MEDSTSRQGGQAARSAHSTAYPARIDANPADRDAAKEQTSNGTIVVKIGGSTLGEHDTTLQDLVSLQREGLTPVVVHGGGKIISDWMAAQNVRPVFKDGLRVTDERSLQIVVAVLAGLINKELVSQLSVAGARALGLSGADGDMLTARVKDPELGYVGEIASVNAGPIGTAMDAGYIPVIAPVARCAADDSVYPDSLLNINADTAAGEIASALAADTLLFLTDVEGVMDRSRRLIPRLTAQQADELTRAGTISGGMIPKIEACLTALSSGSSSHIIDGRQPGAIRDSLSGRRIGTRIG